MQCVRCLELVLLNRCPIAFLIESYVEHVLDNWVNQEGSVPPPFLHGQVLAMVSMAKDAVMASKRPSALADSAQDVTKKRTVKLNTVISQTADEQVELVAAAYMRFKTVFGMFPDELNNSRVSICCDQPVPSEGGFRAVRPLCCTQCKETQDDGLTFLFKVVLSIRLSSRAQFVRTLGTIIPLSSHCVGNVRRRDVGAH
eukprot:1524727-Amphidinium_carterae.1